MRRCYLVLEGHQLFLVTVKAGCINDGISTKITLNCVKIAFSLIHPTYNLVYFFINCGFWSQP